MLSQKHGDEWLPVAYFSKIMVTAELNYEVHDKEMLSIIRSLSHWKSELVGSPYQIRIYTDHKALKYFMTTKTLNARQARWAKLLADYNFVIMYRPGKENPLADALTRRVDELRLQNHTKKQNRLQQLIKDNQIDTRIMQNALRREIDDHAIATLNLAPVTPHFNIVNRILEANRTLDSLQALRIEAIKGHKHLALQDGLLLYDDRLVVPDSENLRTYLIREAHDSVSTAHPGIRKTYLLLSKQYYWPGMPTTIAQYIRNCHACKRSSVPRDRTPGLLHPLPVPERAWQDITMDYCNFNKDKHNFWQEFNRLLGTDIKLSTAHYPQTNNQTKIYNQYLQQRLQPFVSYYQDDWSEFLPMMDYVQLTLLYDSLGGLSSYKALYGYPPRNTWDWDIKESPPTRNLNIQDARKFAKRNQTAVARAKESILRAQEKMSRSLSMKDYPTQRPSKKLDFPIQGRFKIIARVDNSFCLDLPATMKIYPVFPLEKLRKAYNDPLPGQIQEPPPPINITSDSEWEMEKILAVKKVRNTLRYRVSWLNTDADLTWYPASDLKTALHKLRDFHRSNPTQPGPPAQLLEWIKLYESGEDDYDYADNNKPMSAADRKLFFENHLVA
ncbi:hypothetical protein DSL72_003104 [Monilinia vaccinii-corymbosi]|uniref:Chromo domain-containing protein n=1 Tax=Monilinia vaccinii-corymbosi TaxID=61207 RepID=A0A8A3NSC1_9HELO|nr:hypothetical protein DSL72_003104 [Monilinia vaccinii-corymbosi]